MLRRVEIAGYRSIRSLGLDLAPLTVVLGANGAGKTNLYQAIGLIQAAATGRLTSAFAAEGGMPSTLWAGSGWRHEEERETAARGRGKGPVRIRLKAEIEESDFAASYALEVGMPNRISDPALPLDPVVRTEEVRRRLGPRDVVMMSRRGPALVVRGDTGGMETVDSDLLMAETALGAPGEALAEPSVLGLRRRIAGWAFHHHFRTDPGSPLRAPSIAVTAPTLSGDGEGWASVLYTRLYLEANLGSRDDDVARSPITRAIDAAFPGARLDFATSGARIEPLLAMPEFPRPFAATEMSDGTLRYLCLVAALCSLRPARFIALNEPETSLHASLIEPLAGMIGEASSDTQVMLVTHSPQLAEILELDFAARVVRLEKQRGETCVAD